MDLTSTEQSQSAQPLQTVDEDPCCHRRLLRALTKGLVGDSWTCPKCGCEWRPMPIGEARHWRAIAPVMVMPR